MNRGFCRGENMENDGTTGHTMSLNHFSRRQFKRREGSSRITNNRPIDFGKLLLSGKKPVPPASSSLFKNISTALKENVNRESSVCRNVDDFWAAERQKRVSAVARRKLTGIRETDQQTHEQSVEDRKARHARSRRGGGKRTLGAKPIKLDVYIDKEIADWDKENLDVEEEQACTIASSEAFMSAQETALRASLQNVEKTSFEKETFPAACPPAVGTVATQVEEILVDGDHHEHLSCQNEGVSHTDQQNEATGFCRSPEDMDLSPGVSPGCVMQNILNTHNITPDLATLVDMDWSTDSPPKLAVESDCSSHESLRCSTRDAGIVTQHPQTETSSQRLATVLSKRECSGSEPRQALRPCPKSNSHSGGKQCEHRSTAVKEKGCISSLPMDCNLDVDDPRAVHDATPIQDSIPRAIRLPVTSPTPPSNPLAAYLSRRQLLREMGEYGQRKLAFVSSPAASSINTGDTQKIDDSPDCEADWDRISYNDDTYHVDVSEPDHEAEDTHRRHSTPLRSSFPGSALHQAEGIQIPQSTSPRALFPHGVPPDDGLTAEEVQSGTSHGVQPKRHLSDAIQSEESHSLHVQTSHADSGGTHQFGKISTTKSCKGKGVESPRAEAQISFYKYSGPGESSKTGLVKALDFEGKHVASSGGHETKVSGLKSGGAKQVDKTGVSSAARALNFTGEGVDSPKDDELKISAVKSVKMKQVEKGVSAKALNFEDVEMEATKNVGRDEVLTDHPQEATEIEASFPLEIPENTAPLEDLERQDESKPAEEAQAETRQEPQTKRIRRKKVQERRTSLEGGDNGCTWEEGHRRSQRIRVRPLEWWRGEKLLYGRVHDSLTTVIGIKKSSPGQYAQGIKAPFVIESFVPAKYNELVRFAAI